MDASFLGKRDREVFRRADRTQGVTVFGADRGQCVWRPHMFGQGRTRSAFWARVNVFEPHLQSCALGATGEGRHGGSCDSAFHGALCVCATLPNATLREGHSSSQAKIVVVVGLPHRKQRKVVTDKIEPANLNSGLANSSNEPRSATKANYPLTHPCLGRYGACIGCEITSRHIGRICHDGLLLHQERQHH